MTIGWHFDNTYSKLPDTFKENISPVPVKDPSVVILNEELATNLNLNFSNVDKKEIAKILSGNILPTGSNTIAQAYAGHQFGHFTMLGDGRAILIGEHLSNQNKRYDIQFKGSGKTSFSRGGDGRAVLGPMLREYVISEAMHALKIPTTRSLSVVRTGENVVREKPQPGAILTRIASSHIRVGTFQYIAAKQNLEELKILLDYTIDRHFPDIKSSNNKALDLLNIVMEKQCQLVIDWMRVGFIHGVMNTDNMSISGETIDYGPCAFMDQYHPKTVFSSIDQFGRYAYSNQPLIIKWNLARFAECIIPLIDKNETSAVKIATDTINNFEKIYENKWLNMMRGKIGLFGEDKNDKKLIIALLNWMEKNKADYTNTFCYLMNIETSNSRDYNKKEFRNWSNEWKRRLNFNNVSKTSYLNLMRDSNPLVIPRNFKVEEALKAANENDIKLFDKLLKILKNPYAIQKNISGYQSQAPITEKKYQTYCGT
jgi:uncharacterized protein YdiU (UPF0061 family)